MTDPEKYLVLSHFDEYYEDDATHLIEITHAGTAVELSDQTPQMNSRAYLRSGLSNAVLSFEQFPEWFEWFREQHLRGDSFKLQVNTDDSDLKELLTEMDIEFE